MLYSILRILPRKCNQCGRGYIGFRMGGFWRLGCSWSCVIKEMYECGMIDTDDLILRADIREFLKAHIAGGLVNIRKREDPMKKIFL